MCKSKQQGRTKETTHVMQEVFNTKRGIRYDINCWCTQCFLRIWQATNCHRLFKLEDILENVEIWRRHHAIAILNAIASKFLMTLKLFLSSHDG